MGEERREWRDNDLIASYGRTYRYRIGHGITRTDLRIRSKRTADSLESRSWSHNRTRREMEACNELADRVEAPDADCE